MYGIGVVYFITVAASMRAIQTANCYHIEGYNAACTHGNITTYMLMYGAVQIVASLIPNFHSIDWLSVIPAIMSFVYSLVGFVLGLANVMCISTKNGKLKGSVPGIQVDTQAKKVWLIFEAFGNIAYAYPYSLLLLEIQIRLSDTLNSPPAENKTMKKASMIAISLTTFFYYRCACFGYAAFGNNTPGNILTGFNEPYWLIGIANACVILHLVGDIRYSAVFAFVESWFANFSKCGLMNIIKLPLLPPLELSLFRLLFRTAYVASTTAVAILFTYFNHILAIYFPVEMCFVQKNVETWTRKWIALRAFSFFCLIISIVGLIGSVEGLISAKLKG
ncbi:hypothetical protein K2173_010455 [Erythroxylum novogranatense]|uniref:Amino acid transporter transmembrane domain-containing protein n=1 Tax=Erythroxylum novogranatense TaxID=1862640 RepID=A0AAV8TG27_9ROSI|nr:hypothetical protein K2173_010455 [Erythroxylum novogranatense]